MTNYNRIPPPLFLLLVLLLLVTPTSVHGFASYLLSNMGCMTDLSTDEVIMNSPVVSASDSDHKEVHLELVSPLEHVSQTEALGDGSTRIFLTRGEVALPLRLIAGAEGLHDVQFVVETSEGAQMERGQCDNAKRIAGRGSDTVVLQMGTESPVFVWAGWATGHEAVRLTPALEIHIGGGPLKKEEQDEPVVVDQEKEQAKKELQEQLEAYNNAEKAVKKEKPEDGRHPEDDRRREHNRHHHRIDEDVQGDDKKGEVSSRRRRQKEDSTSRKAPRSADQHHQQHPVKRSFTQKIKEHIEKHKRKDAKEEPGITLDTTWFMYGLGILLVGNFLAVKCCTFAAGKAGGDSSTKSRRLHNL